MLKITDCRKSCDMKLKDIYFGKFFFYDDRIYRRIDVSDNIKNFSCTFIDDDFLPVWDVEYGMITGLHRDTYVEPIRNEQIELIIDD